jgi:hypothetical protein
MLRLISTIRESVGPVSSDAPLVILESKMNLKLLVRISENSGMPFTCVPTYAMWDLVEFLATHRTPVLYGYSPEGFTVTFQRLDRQSAQDLLDQWAQPHTPLSPAQDTGKFDDDLCYTPR